VVSAERRSIGRGGAGPLDTTDFAPRPWVEHSGWPFGFEELRTYYGQAQSLADLGAFDYSAASWFHRLRSATPPLESDDFGSIIWQLSRPTHFGQKYANPTLTLLALALRLGDRLARIPS